MVKIPRPEPALRTPLVLALQPVRPASTTMALAVGARSALVAGMRLPQACLNALTVVVATIQTTLAAQAPVIVWPALWVPILCLTHTCLAASIVVTLSPCVNCPYGYYGTTTGSSGCTGCPAGKTTTYTGATSASACVDCDQGKYGTNGQPGCTDCGGGTWQGLYGHIGSCTNRPDGKYVAPGAGLTEDSCNSCFIEHTYAPQGSSYSSDCIYCDAGYGTDFGNEQYDCQIVSDGYYRTQFDDFLTPCPVGTTGQWSTSGIVPTGDDMCTVCPEGRLPWVKVQPSVLPALIWPCSLRIRSTAMSAVLEVNMAMAPLAFCVNQALTAREIRRLVHYVQEASCLLLWCHR